MTKETGKKGFISSKLGVSHWVTYEAEKFWDSPKKKKNQIYFYMETITCPVGADI